MDMSCIFDVTAKVSSELIPNWGVDRTPVPLVPSAICMPHYKPHLVLLVHDTNTKLVIKWCARIQ